MMATSYEPLFLKYRPQTFADLVGQESVKDTLSNAIAQSKLVHAYLFTGPRGSGKTSSARILAKSLNCEQGPTINPCGQCASCKSIANSNSVDVVEIDAASHGHVEDARSLIERVSLASIGGRFKIYIIDEVHMLSTAAFNALLKVFEEPPAKVVFILATTEEDKVLPTIVSRCQKFNFRRITINDCVMRMRYVAEEEGISIEDEALAFIAKRSDGAMRDALSLLDQLSVFNHSIITKAKVLDILGGVSEEDIQELITNLLKRDIVALLEGLDKLYAAGKEAVLVCKELLQQFLEVLELQDLAFCADLLAEYKVENFELVQIIDSLSTLEQSLKQSTQAKNLLRAEILKLAYRQDIHIIRELEERLTKLELKLSTRGAPVGGGSVRIESSPAVRTTNSTAAKTESSSAVRTTNSTAAKTESSSATRMTNSAAAKTESSIKPVTQGDTSSGIENDFISYLSPACKGILLSSKAVLVGIEGAKAKIAIPSRFKFLKGKLEAKSEEILSAIRKASAQLIDSLEIELHDDDLQQVSNTLSLESPEKAVSKPDLQKPLQNSNRDLKTVVEEKKTLIDDSGTSSPCCDRAIEEENLETGDPGLNPGFAASQLEDIVKMGIQVFNAKEI